jgi:hypothetical protein
MRNLGQLAMGTILIAVLACFIVARDRTQRQQLQHTEGLLQLERDQISYLQEENARLSNLVQHTVSLRVSTSQPSSDLLRLRGEVGRLRREVEIQGQKKDEEIAALRQQSPSLPNIRESATRAKVLAELTNMGATMTWQDENEIHAQFPSADSNGPPRFLHFVFADGKLDSIRPPTYWPGASESVIKPPQTP